MTSLVNLLDFHFVYCKVFLGKGNLLSAGSMRLILLRNRNCGKPRKSRKAEKLKISKFSRILRFHLP